MISRRSRKALLICAAICIVFIPLVSARASKTTFYPEECIGDWKELQNAEGKTDAHDIAEIDSSNAAESNRVGSRVVCSKFSDASLSNLRPTFAELSLFVRPIGSDSTGTVVSQILKKYNTNVFAEEESVASTTTVEVTISSTSTEVSIPVIVEEQSTSTVVDISTSTPVLDEATSSLEFIPAVVDATSTGSQPEEITATTTEATSTTVLELPTQNLEPLGTSTEEILINTASTTEVEEALSSESEIEAQISFDEGVTWALVGNGVVSGVTPISFVVPLASLKTGDDISKMSVRLIKTGGSMEMLLDGMSLSVSFSPLTDNDKKVVLADVVEKNPDFSNEAITRMINTQHLQVFSTKNAEGISSLWVYVDTPSGTTTPFLVATGDRFVSDAPIAVKNDILFWLNGVDDVYGFRAHDHRLLVPLSKRDLESGEREFIFSETPWKVVSRGGIIQFFSSESGEIGGDDDGSLRQEFYAKHLEQSLSEEEQKSLGEFGLDTGATVIE